jgi:hypothetical protein
MYLLVHTKDQRQTTTQRTEPMPCSRDAGQEGCQDTAQGTHRALPINCMFQGNPQVYQRDYY